MTDIQKLESEVEDLLDLVYLLFDGLALPIEQGAWDEYIQACADLREARVKLHAARNS